MRLFGKVCLVAAAGLLSACVGGGASNGAAPAQDTTSTAPGSIDWRTDLDAARAEALRDGKPLLAVFRCEP